MATVRFSRRVLARIIAGRLIAEPSRQRHWMRVLAAYLITERREAEADLLINDIERELYQQAGQLAVKVTSARPLHNNLRLQLTKMLVEQTGAKHLSLSEAVDPALLGGLIARTPDAELDASVRTKLARLRTIT